MDHRLIATAVGIASFGAGAFAGYKVALRRLEQEFDNRLDDETKHMKEFYTKVPSQKYATPEEAVADLVLPDVVEREKVAYHKIVKSEYESDDDTEEKVAEVKETIVSVFEKRRDPTVPYLISQEEHMQNETGYQQPTLTYYEKDDKLADESDELIEQVEETVGLDFKVNFGYDSSDENSVYVRNERLMLDFEIVRDERSYQSQVLGEDDLSIDPPVERISARMRREREQNK